MNQEMKQAFEGIKNHIDTQISHVREDIFSLENRMTNKMVELADFMMESLEDVKTELRTEMLDMKTELKSEFKKDLLDTKAELKSEFKKDLSDTKAELKSEFKKDLLDTKIELKKDIADSAFEIRKNTVSQHDFSLLTKRVEVLEG